jgi:ABC-type multidrug transport system fused ATPase/permease subunit
MKNLLHYMKGKKVQAVLAPLLKVFEAVFELIIPIIVADIVDVGIANSDGRYIITRCAVMIALGIVGLAFTIVSQYFSAECASFFAFDLKKDLLKHADELSFSDIEKLGQGNVVTLMTNDVDRLQSGVNMALRLFMRSPFIVFGALIAAFCVDIIGASVFAVALPVLFAIVFSILISGTALYKKSQNRLENITVLTRENVTGARVIRAFAKEDETVGEFRSENAGYTKTQLKAGRVAALMNPLTYAVINTAIIMILYVGGIRIDGGFMTQGQIIALYNYMSQILLELIKLANLTATLAKAAAAGKRVSEFLAVKPSQIYPEKAPVSETDEKVRFSNVSISYSGAGKALDNVSFSLNKGETLGVIGGTGSGKSTLCSLIARFYDATEGTVSVDGNDVRSYPKDALRNKIAVVAQGASLFSDTIENNIVFGRKFDGEAFSEAVRISQSDDILRAKANGADESVMRGGSNFSGGQRQRLSIARALYGRPEILVLDDSFSALDNITAAKLRAEIKKLGTTTVIVSRSAGAVMRADKILVLDGGRIIGFGTHENLLASCSAYREIYEMQFGGV